MCSRGFHVSSALFLLSFPYPSDQARHPKNDNAPEGPISDAGQTLCVYNLCTSTLVGFTVNNQYIFQMVFSSGLTTEPPGFARWFPTRTHYCRNWGTEGAFGETIYPAVLHSFLQSYLQMDTTDPDVIDAKSRALGFDERDIDNSITFCKY